MDNNIIKPNWDNFKAKFSEDKQGNFEWFCYLLFSKEHNRPKGIFRYKNQSAIETEPIQVKNKLIGWQAKFYEVPLSQKNKEIIETIKKAKRDYPNITDLIFYTNQEWGQGRGGKAPKGKTDVEILSKELNINIEWRTASFFESEFVSTKNTHLSKYFFTLNQNIDNAINNSNGHTQLLLKNISTSMNYNGNKIELNRDDDIQKLNDSSVKVIILNGVAGVGKTSLIKKYYEKQKKDIPFYLIKATEFLNSNLNTLFNGFMIDDFIDAHKEEKKKIFVIDSAEKILDLEDDTAFKELLSILLKNDWTLIFTTRDSYLNILNYELKEIYNIIFENISINNLTDKELLKLSKEYEFSRPSDFKLKMLIRNPFNLSQYLQHYQKNNDLSYLEFKNNIWETTVIKRKPQQEQCFLKIAKLRADNGNFFVNPSCESSIVDSLNDSGILGYESPHGYFITHDIYEEWALEKIIESEFIKRENNLSFFQTIGSSLAIRRSFRNWVSEKLLLDSDDIKPFIEEIIDNHKIELFWKDEIFVSVLLSDYSDTFFGTFEKELLANDYELLKRISFLLRVACKEVDNSLLEQYKLNLDDLDIFSMFNKPKGLGWESFIAFVYKYIDDIGLNNINIMVPIIHDWNSKERESDATRLASLIALKYYENGYKSEKIIQSILYGALKIENELVAVFDKVIREKDNDRKSLYYDLIKIILTDYSGMSIYKKPFIKPLLQLCDLFWFKNYDLEQFGDGFHNYSEKKYCITDSYDFKYFPSHVYKTPIYFCLKEDMNETIRFILSFVNKVVECYEKKENNRVIKVHLSINNKKIQQCHSIDLWTAYRGSGNIPLFESIHMSLELYLLEIGKLLESKELNILLLNLLKNSKSSSISAIVSSVVNAYPEKTFDIALILFGVQEFIIYDNSRVGSEHIDFDILSDFNIDLLYKPAMEQLNKYTHRKNSLEFLLRNYQFFDYGYLDDKMFKKRQEQIWKLLDEYKKNIDYSDTTWRFCLARIDRRDMSPTVEKEGEGQLISFNPKIDDDLIEKSKITSESINESLKYVTFTHWAEYKYRNDDQANGDNYVDYEKNPELVIEKVKEIVALSEDEIKQYHLIGDETLCNSCCILMRDYKDSLSEKDKKFCRDILIDILDNNSGIRSSEKIRDFLPYLMLDFDDKKIKTLLYDSFFHGYSINLKIWDISYKDALSLLIGYLVLKPQYLQLFEKKRSEFDKKNRYASFEEVELLNSFIKNNEVFMSQIIENTISVNQIIDYTKINIYTLMQAFEFVPNDVSDVKLKDISKNIILIVSNEFVLDEKDKFDFEKVNAFVSKLSYIVLNLKQEEIKDYLSPFIENFKGDKIFSILFTELIRAQDKLKKYDNFWYIWELFEDKVFELCRNGDGYWYIKEIIHSYFLAKTSSNSNIWKSEAKDWHTLKDKDKKFFKRISKKIGHCPSVLYAISKLLTDVGSSYLSDGIGWISYIVQNNKNLLIDKLESDTIFNLEIITRKYILQNRQTIKKQKAKKEEILEILNFLVERGSAIGYMLRERIL